MQSNRASWETNSGRSENAQVTVPQRLGIPEFYRTQMFEMILLKSLYVWFFINFHEIIEIASKSMIFLNINLESVNCAGDRRFASNVKTYVFAYGTSQTHLDPSRRTMPQAALPLAPVPRDWRVADGAQKIKC